MKVMRVIFMGTPQFAVPALKKLLQTESLQVVAVYTKPPKQSGRGMNLVKSPVHLVAEEHNVSVITPESLRGEEVLSNLKKFAADIIVVAAYGLILPATILTAVPYGCINIHPSDLPRWRGAAPIQRTILAGDQQTALCIMQMDEGLDTGEVILRHKFDIPAGMTAAELENVMANLGAEKLIEALDLISKDQAVFEKQHTEGVTYAPKIDHTEAKIDWHKTAAEIIYQIRAFCPRPGAYFIYKNEVIKIIEATIVHLESAITNSPGLVIDDKMTIACGVDAIRPTLLQRQGRKMIYTDAFLRGFAVQKNSIIS